MKTLLAVLVLSIAAMAQQEQAAVRFAAIPCYHGPCKWETYVPDAQHNAHIVTAGADSLLPSNPEPQIKGWYDFPDFHAVQQANWWTVRLNFTSPPLRPIKGVLKSRVFWASYALAGGAAWLNLHHTHGYPENTSDTVVSFGACMGLSVLAGRYMGMLHAEVPPTYFIVHYLKGVSQ